ncbi:MAG: peptide deformylase [Bacteroidales bacterium]|nr:peptide deformylase [Bacteroidales bacterium]
MIRPVVRDVLFLSRKSEPVTERDRPLGSDLRDTLQANRDRCVGMAANMIGVNRRAIIVNIGFADVVMFNPVLLARDTPYEAEEGCLSLDGTRRTTRWKNIEIEYFDEGWKPRRQRFSGWIAQIIQHEMDHLEGVII